MSRSRRISILIFPSPLFPAHWSLFIASPSPTTESIGTRIHVHGDAKAGFAHEFVRGYDVSRSTLGDKLVPLGVVDEAVLAEGKGEGEGCQEHDGVQTETRDVDARNELERIALSVPAPGPSLNSVQHQARFFFLPS